MNTIDKYSIDKLSNAIDDAVDVSFRQMIDTIKNQCYMSQTETSWEDCDELEFLEEHPKMSTIKDKVTNEMKRVVLSALTFSDWISEDEVAKRNPNKFRKPNAKIAHNNLPTPSYETEVSRLKDKHWKKSNISTSEFREGFKKPSENTIGLYQQEINDVTVLALETLREQVRDAGDNYNHFRVNKVLKFYKNKF